MNDIFDGIKNKSDICDGVKGSLCPYSVTIPYYTIYLYIQQICSIFPHEYEFIVMPLIRIKLNIFQFHSTDNNICYLRKF